MGEIPHHFQCRLIFPEKGEVHYGLLRGYVNKCIISQINNQISVKFPIDPIVEKISTTVSINSSNEKKKKEKMKFNSKFLDEISKVIMNL